MELLSGIGRAAKRMVGLAPAEKAPQQIYEEAEAGQKSIPVLQAAAQIAWERIGSLCDSRGFTQHLGECWNDTDQTILMNSDFCKEQLQGLFIHEELTPEFCRITKEE